MLLYDEYVTYRESIRCERSVNTQRTHLKRPTNTPETPHIHTAKTILLQHNRIGTKIH